MRAYIIVAITDETQAAVLASGQFPADLPDEEAAVPVLDPGMIYEGFQPIVDPVEHVPTKIIDTATIVRRSRRCPGENHDQSHCRNLFHHLILAN